MGIGTWIGENKGSIAFTVIVMLLGTAGYFALGIGEGMTADKEITSMSNPNVTNLTGISGETTSANANVTIQNMTAQNTTTMLSNGTTPGAILQKMDPAVFEGIRYKVASAPDGSVKLFANAKNNALATLKSSVGESIPEDNSMIIGYTAAERMKKENISVKPNDNLENYFGLKMIYIGGILERTGTPVDDLDFLGTQNFENVTGIEGLVFSKLTEDNVPKIFYYLGTNETVPKKFVLAEGNMSGYSIHDLGGAEYYPLVIGSDEAGMMREEKKFSEVGEEIRGFFGKNVVVVGVLEKTNTSLDIMHFIPLHESQIG